MSTAFSLFGMFGARRRTFFVDYGTERVGRFSKFDERPRSLPTCLARRARARARPSADSPPRGRREPPRAQRADGDALCPRDSRLTQQYRKPRGHDTASARVRFRSRRARVVNHARHEERWHRRRGRRRRRRAPHPRWCEVFPRGGLRDPRGREGASRSRRIPRGRAGGALAAEFQPPGRRRSGDARERRERLKVGKQRPRSRERLRAPHQAPAADQRRRGDEEPSCRCGRGGV